MVVAMDMPVGRWLSCRDFATEPYGVFGKDYYVDREEFLQHMDYDFYHAFVLNDSNKGFYGGFGVESFEGNIAETSPTSSGHICNLGIQRRVTTAIHIRTFGTQ